MHEGRSTRRSRLLSCFGRLKWVWRTARPCPRRARRQRSSARVIEALADVMVAKGVPEHIRSDNGPECVAKDLRKWLADTGAKTLYIAPCSRWENGYCESFNSKLRDELLNGEIFYSLKEVQVLARVAGSRSCQSALDHKYRGNGPKGDGRRLQHRCRNALPAGARHRDTPNAKGV